MERNAKLASAVALFVVVASALVVIPSLDAAYAETTVPAETGGDALLGQAVDGTIVLQNDVVLTSALIVTGELTIDLNGHGIVNSDANANHTIEVSETGDLTIEDSVGTGTIDNVIHAKAVVYNKGTVTIEGGEFFRSSEVAEPDEEHADSWYTIQNHGVMTIDGGTFVGGVEGNMGNVSSVIINGLEDAPEGETAELTINDATVLGSNGTLKNEANGTLTVNGGTFIMDNTETQWYGANNMLLNYGVAEISGATFTALGTGISSDSSEGYFRSCVFNAGEVVIDDVVFTMSGNNNRMFNVPDFAGSLTINGGTFMVEDDMEQGFEPSCLMHIRANVDEMAVTINDGLFLGDFFIDETSAQQLTVNGGYFSEDVSAFVPETKTIYDFQGVSVVSEVVSDPVIVIDDVPFASMDDVADLINAAGGNVEGDDDTLTLLGDFQVGGADISIPAGSTITIDLNGNDMVFAAVDVAGTLTLTDDSQNKGTITCTNFNVNGGTLTGDVLVGSASGDALVYINGSGTVSGLGFDISDMTGGAVTVNPGATGAVTISDVIVIVDGPESAVDRGIYVNQTAVGGSVTIQDVVFNFNDNDACPVNIDIDSSSVVKVSDLTYNDCARPNKFLVNATSDVTVGSEGNLDFDHAGDAVFWDAADEGNTFTVAGELIVDGLLTVTSGGHLVVPSDADMVVNGSVVVTSDASVTGELVFGSDRANSIDLSDVVAGDPGLKLSLGSVVISGSVVSGMMVLNGNGLIEGDVDMGAATLEIPKDSSLVVPADASVSGTAAMKVAGVVSVFGSVATPLQNSGTVSVYDGGEVTGKVSGTDVIDIDEVVVAIGSIKDVSIGLGQELRVAVAVIPVDARITASIGETPLDVNGRTISWTPEEAGTYTVSVTAEYDGQVDTETFKVIVSDPSADDDDPIDWRLVVIGVILVVMVIALIARFV